MSGGRLIARRASHDRLLVLAAAITVVFALAMLAALTGYSATVTREGLTRTLAGAGFDEVGTRASKQVKGGEFGKDDALLRERLAGAYPGIPLEVSASARGDSYALPGQRELARPQLTTFTMYTGIGRHASLTEGR